MDGMDVVFLLELVVIKNMFFLLVLFFYQKAPIKAQNCVTADGILYILLAWIILYSDSRTIVWSFALQRVKLWALISKHKKETFIT